MVIGLDLGMVTVILSLLWAMRVPKQPPSTFWEDAAHIWTELQREGRG
jgi:hypothetical protein